MINLTINGKAVQAPDDSTIMQAAALNNILIPNLCYYEKTHAIGSCRICVVEVEGAKTLQASCITKAREGMVVRTNTDKVRKARRVLYELMLSDHNQDCLACSRNQSCELQELGKTLGVDSSRFEGERLPSVLDSSISITRDLSKCILCRRCVTICNEIQGTSILNAQNRGFATVIGPSMDLALGEVDCAFCGQCTVVCPVGALSETSSTEKVWNALNNPDLRVVVQIAPAVRVAVGEEFGFPAGSRVTGKLATALADLGFDDVFDTNWAADLTIIEEGTEFLSRVKAALTGGKSVLPIITSCSPGWIKFIEHNFPDQLDHLSTCKSPHTMMGAVVKSYYAQKIGIDPKKMFVVSVMPCTAKKFEIERPEMMNNGLPNVDAVITTRELAQMIKTAGIDFANLPEGEFDQPLGLSTGAADIFGVTGGVMEAALRTVYELVTGRELPFDKLHVEPIVGLDGVKDATIKIENTLPAYDFLEGVEVKVAVTSGLKNARVLMQQVKDGTSPYHFIEVMGCPGGCITGGGQPRSKDPEVRSKRLTGLYDEDESKVLRKSHENPSIIAFYNEFLGEPNGHLAHELLHTHYTKRGIYNDQSDDLVIPTVKREVAEEKPEVEVSPLAVQLHKRDISGARAQQEINSAHASALESENARLKAELDDLEKTVETLKRVIADSNKK
ncbi:MAG TPA: NADH-dependent [FeFe] hydrogenase, group A6 [Clostridiales bacterium]|nr:NADH-dependent [FeFe] hydrogenase, group A6 [Clostridiales bacterium]HRT81550.1 NADH-dependent [FeFe] hydrogenase, group A6 [Oscillospiraceae bacterium]